jgi:hypothetical protein
MLLTIEAAAAMLGLPVDAIAAAPSWLDTGSEQLLIQAASREAVLAARPDPACLPVMPACDRAVVLPTLWHVANNLATVRLFYEQEARCWKTRHRLCLRQSWWLVQPASAYPCSGGWSRGGAAAAQCIALDGG